MFFWKLISISIRSQMQYSASFLTLCLAHFLATSAYILGVWALFDRFHMVKGWTFYEVCLIYGIVNIGYGIAESFARGFENFSRTLIQGDFDRILLRPVRPLIQMATHDVQLMRLSRALQGGLVLAWSLSHFSFSMFSIQTLVIVFSIIGTASLFYGLLIIQAAISFWTIETLEIMSITTYGGLQAGQYPMSIYDRPFRLIFTILIPLSCVAYYPVAILLRHESIPIGWAVIAPLSGLIFLYLACRLWNFGARHYLSTGS
ncbi:MAG: putative rane protein [Parachlamydiales bacterium]|nr:putative rane protein [Parachlamydiales bacterium]